SRASVYRLAAVALIVGAILSGGGNLLGPQGGARASLASGLYFPVVIAVLLGGLLVMASASALYLRQRAESGTLGIVGMAAILLAGMPLTVGFPLIQALMFPWLGAMPIPDRVLNSGPDVFNLFFAVASAVVSIGGVLFGIATVRARVFSRALGVSFIVLALASFVLGFLSLPGGGGIHMSWWWATTGTFGVLAYMVGLAWYGIELFQRASPEAHSAVLGTP
ncbi:MAG TPA: hypothetical protein VFS62_00715, partial [Chloroflexota bacterium]|nr:hypothetical protein [Chloroflexota bacterium]